MDNNAHIAILDFGSQYTHLIARRIRELGVKSRIYPNETEIGQFGNSAIGIILSGGPRSVAREPALSHDPAIFQSGIPILGLCYGHQLIARHFGGIVASGIAREYGLAQLSIFNISAQGGSVAVEQYSIFKNISSCTNVWMSHGDHVETLPPGFTKIATTGNNSVAAMSQEEKKIYGFQFHPEVRHTTDGGQMLSNFVFNICGAEVNWTSDSMMEEIQKDIRRSAGDKNVFLLVSGGVDSTVCFALLEKTLDKNRVYGLHVDNGLMRLNESASIRTALKTIGLDDLRVYDAAEEMLEQLKDVCDPEKKRNIIGDLFLDIAERVMKEVGVEKNWLLCQGTIYPDTIESGGTKHSDKIKTHHNRVDRVNQMIDKGLVIEPLKNLYKDEVREIARLLGLPAPLVNRHPFPGPGLAIRCLCSEKSSYPPALEQWNNGTIVRMPIKSVGVQGDERSYSHPALVFSPLSGGMKGGLNWHGLRTLSPQITNTHKNVNRVLFLVSGDENKILDSTIKQAYVTKDRLDLLRNIDAIVRKHTFRDTSCNHIWQFPVVLVPFGYRHRESVVLRPVESQDAMTVSFAELPDSVLANIKQDVERLGAIDFIFYDITNKPPGTIEWE
ncbi:MAG: hypothetical protein A3C90_01100 [Candidatus Magasanikbacteria bacterium RIFCSPHIGHO2_02_FULL_51_14]|uniref:GMP synthase (glutamine-hydrolyzing) n=1 Tax=Candidatus Magasanikbacteria bacterium RIFCSPHIGHO2_02_FULL_51_14 TaxID=1798683 RepID=A0A1F6MFA8_9BACT|nr:MAG: hypothetical protein A3C90_01100 [Candidatus Magasanikbacteria bacterium RIFCSPHIGHO2_02_FULL_51_14]